MHKLQNRMNIPNPIRKTTKILHTIANFSQIPPKNTASIALIGSTPNAIINRTINIINIIILIPNKNS
jgi:hypothetical protein